MIIAWGLFAPVGILLALFYKVVWPNGEWFYVSAVVQNLLKSHLNISGFLFQTHIAIMIATLLLTLAGIIPIVIHAGGLWLSSTVSSIDTCHISKSFIL